MWSDFAPTWDRKFLHPWGFSFLYHTEGLGVNFPAKTYYRAS